ncbi:F-box associated domain [Musa troglodytarum]|uniref:F-box associated domain n=1 Tax=Musa troglodytarum TaxID=320322 RepID=A0A9E7FAW2_9LILI|nr:F-box associated domain [Musa troglodytarum]
MEKTSSELPPDLFMEILSWIPARALLKLRCVRKHWYSMTTDLVFIRLHLQRQQLLPKVTSVLTFHKHLINDRALLSLLDVVDAPRSIALAMEVLTVGGSTWRKVEVSSARTMFTSIKMGRPSATGVMYWLAQRQGSLEDIILSVDLHDERLVEVPLPQTKRHHDGGNKSLTELEGTIHLVIHWFAKVGWMDIWMFQESCAHRLWIRRFHLRLRPLPRGVGQVERELRPPMPLLINQGKILMCDRRRLVYYDLASKGLQQEEVFRAHDEFVAFVIVESFVSF